MCWCAVKKLLTHSLSSFNKFIGPELIQPLHWRGYKSSWCLYPLDEKKSSFSEVTPKYCRILLIETLQIAFLFPYDDLKTEVTIQLSDESNVLGQEITQPVRWPLFCHRRANAVEQSAWTTSATGHHLGTIQTIVENVCLVSWAAAPCIWTLRALTRNLLTYLQNHKQIRISWCIAVDGKQCMYLWEACHVQATVIVTQCL